MSSGAPRFISEKEIEERKARDAAEGKAEEPYDARSLYDRLQTERARKQEEYESQKAFKNQIHRLDDDEVAFLVEKDLEKCRNEESAEEEARKLILEAKISFLLPTYFSNFNLFSVFADIFLDFQFTRPHSPTKIEPKKSHTEQNDTSDPNGTSSTSPQSSEPSEEITRENAATTGPACVLAGILPGLDAYENSSDDDSDDNSSSDVEDAALTISSIADSRVKKNRREANE
ncbi:unnamed protein product [Hymenolepis diminuta]|uniref:Nefa_Nip30_N domain-containing protein n=2 Tax=Hymenolepis diminuta TaxID=6216 RepID=A0A0R3SX98_HYMDI|nr:unnamed protein product [Hymenolepis diminuta]